MLDGYAPPPEPVVLPSRFAPRGWLARLFAATGAWMRRVWPWGRHTREYHASPNYRWSFPRYTRVDPVAFARAVKAEEHGRRDGSTAQPAAEAREYPPAVQEMIILGRQKLDEAVGEQRGVMVEAQRRIQNLRVPEPGERMGYVRRRATQEMAERLHAAEVEWMDAAKRVAGANREYLRFKSDNGLFRDAEEPAHWLWYGVLALILISAETVLNYRLFEDATDQGTQGAVLIAAAIATFNITVSTLAGYVFGRQCLRRQRLPRVFGWTMSVLFFAAMTAAHSLFATLRFLASQGTDVDVAVRSVWQWSNLQGAAGDGLSLLLVTVGLIISAFGFWKGMTMLSDRYPGFLRVYRLRLKERHAYEALVADAMDEQGEITARAHAELDVLVQQAEAIHGESNRRVVELQALNDQHEVVIDDHSAAVQHAVNVYVAANRAHRGPAPLPAILRVPIRLRSVVRRLDIDTNAIQAANDRGLAATRDKAVEVRRLLSEDHIARLEEMRRREQDVHGRAEHSVERDFRPIVGGRLEDVRFGPDATETAAGA